MADEEEMSTMVEAGGAEQAEGSSQPSGSPKSRVVVAAAEGEAGEVEEENSQASGSPKKRAVKRKPKRRTMDAHFWGMSDAEIASIKASLAAEAAEAADEKAQGDKDATPVVEDAAAKEEQHEDDRVEEEVPEGQLPKKEIEERRRILHTDWRMAAFSQFAHCFPHLCIKEFSIEKLEKDLDGTEPGSYVGEVISRLLYHLTKDSALAGKSPDKPWLIRLRREFLRRDPSHNKLGDGPLSVGSGDFYDDEDEDNTATQHTLHNEHTLHTGNASPNVDQSAADTPQPPTQEHTEDNGASKAEGIQPEPDKEGENSMTGETNGKKEEVKQEDDKDDKPAWLAEFPNSKGWEDLELQDQIYALWAVTEWHLSNADKFRNILVKYRIEPEQPFWRIEPIGYDKDYNVYWMFDDFRLWIERQTPARRQQLVLLEETAERLQAREKARQKRIRHEQRMRMKALHERRRQRIAAKKAAEEALDLEIAEMDEMDKKKAQDAIANGKTTGKRKRVAVQEVIEEDEADDDFAAAEEEEEEENHANVRTSSRISRTRKANTAALAPAPVQTRSDRRRSTRNSSAGNLAAMQIGTNGTEEWEKIPPEWMKSEEDERDDDPDFGAEEEEQENGVESENESELSMLDEDEEEASKGIRKVTRTSQRQRRSGPRKSQRGRTKQTPATGESELSDLSDVDGMSLDEAEDGEEDDGEEKIDLNETAGHYPNSAWESYEAVPSYDDEDKDQPEGFVHWELLIKELPEWLDFSEKYFPETEDSREVALVSWVDEQVIPRVNAELERREEVRKKEEAARKAAERKARIEREKAAGGTPPIAAGPSKANRSFRSSRIAQKEAKEAEERAKALAEERLHRQESQMSDRGVPAAMNELHPDAPQLDAKIVERDRRAARAKEREEAKKAKEEADLLAELEESQGGPPKQAEQFNIHTAQLGSQIPMQYSGPPSSGSMSNIAPVQSQAMHHMQMQGMPMPQMQPQTQVPQVHQMQALAPAHPAPAEQLPEAEASEPAIVEESEDYFLDCSVCKKRGLNLDPNTRLVACDVCDRWEHVVCHRKQDEKEGKPKRDWENDPFLCEDCEGLEDSVILPSAPKRERSEKQKLGAKKGAEKRKAKSAAERAKKAVGKAVAVPTVPKAVKASSSLVGALPSSSASPGANGRNTPAGSVPASNGRAQAHPQVAPGMQMPQQVQRNPGLPVQPTPQQIPSPMYQQQQHQSSHSPYHPGAPLQSPSLTPYANMPSPSLQPQPHQYPSQPYPPGQFQGQQVQQGMQIRPPGQGMPSPHYMPQQQGQLPPYAVPQQGFPGNTSAFQGNFAPPPPQQGNFAGAPSPQMYAQQNNMQTMYRGGMSPIQQQHHSQGNYQPGYPVASYPYGTGAPSSAFAQQQPVPHNMHLQQQHQQQQHQHQHQQFMHAGNGMNHLPNQGHQQPPSRGPQ